MACVARQGYGSSSALRKLRYSEPQEPVAGPHYYLSYSPTSGSIFEALKDALLRQLNWHLGPTPHALEGLDPAQRFYGIDVVLGDRYHMDGLIRDWRDHIARLGRLKRNGHREATARPRRKHVVLVNYYSGTKELSLKSSMVRNLRAHLPRPWEVTPVTFILRPNSLRDQRDHFVREYAAWEGAGETLWIVKPARMNKAIGIRVMQGVDDILEYVETHGEPGEWVVQKYIERPFLLEGRKFDIRTWAVVDPNYDVWLWKEGVLRTASELYDPTDLDNDLSHLTNHCVQETGPNFSRYELGNEMWYHQFQAYLDRHHPGYNFRERVIPRIKAIIRECFLAIKPLVVHSFRSETHDLLCYQVFGFDFMMDDSFETWLIEINGQPAVAEALLPAFTHDCIQLLIRPALGGAVRAAPHRFEPVDPNSVRRAYA
eukprot:EG_transcript_10139